MMTPFICRVGIGTWAAANVPELIGPNASETSFALAIGLLVSATALPDILLWIGIAALLSCHGGAAGSGLGTFLQTCPPVVISHSAFSTLFLMALVTTALTMPLAATFNATAVPNAAATRSPTGSAATLE
jgi:hypothetical protein